MWQRLQLEAHPTAACAALLAACLLLALTVVWRTGSASAQVATVVLSVYPDGSGSVDVTAVDPAGNPVAAQVCADSADIGVVCHFTYDRGTQVTLTATADATKQSSFAGWLDYRCVDKQPCTLTLTDDEQYEAALFSPQSVKVRRGGTGTIAANGTPCVDDRASVDPMTGIAGVVDCGRFPLLATVTLVATGAAPTWDATQCDPPRDATPLASGTARCVVDAVRFRWTTVRFTDDNGQQLGTPPPSQGKLKVRAPLSGGRVRSLSGDIDCPGRCDTDLVLMQTTETLTAEESAGSRFVRWDGCKPRAGAPNTCVALGGATVNAEFVDAQAPQRPSAAGRPKVERPRVTGRGPGRRVRFFVTLHAPATVRASLVRAKSTYGHVSPTLAAGRRQVSVPVNASARRGTYQLKVTIGSGATAQRFPFPVRLPR